MPKPPVSSLTLTASTSDLVLSDDLPIALRKGKRQCVHPIYVQTLRRDNIKEYLSEAFQSFILQQYGRIVVFGSLCMVLKIVMKLCLNFSTKRTKMRKKKKKKTQNGSSLDKVK